MPTFLSDRTDLYTLGAEYPQAVVDAGGLPLLLPQALHLHRQHLHLSSLTRPQCPLLLLLHVQRLH